jgi:hypothetical protein
MEEETRLERQEMTKMALKKSLSSINIIEVPYSSRTGTQNPKPKIA